MFRKTALPELLSPAGSFDAVVAAVNAGADAVYFGGKQLNARAFARNFDDEEIARAVVYCHLHGAKAYVTLNTLLFSVAVIAGIALVVVEIIRKGRLHR